VRDVAVVEDASDIQTGYALVNGRRTVYIPVTKRADASTLEVVDLVKKNLTKFQEALPAGAEISYEFDQSPYVTRAIMGLTMEGLLGAALTGLMVLLFLRDWRTALVVVLNIPLALLAAVIGVWLCGQTINIMTLGGFALAVGMLVDEATVTIENIHTHLARGEPLALAAIEATRETAVPRFLAMLSVVAVFIPAFFMVGAAKALFTPLALAVGFSMFASYILSTTLVPVLSTWMLRATGHHDDAMRGIFARVQGGYSALTRGLVRVRWLVVLIALGGAAAIIWIFGANLGTEIFPIVDAGQFQLRLRAPNRFRACHGG
jgi:multidrug efflux pump subunit AcrB